MPQGAAPTKTAAYAYSIQPKSKQNKIFKVAVNNIKAQGIVLPNGKIAALFLQDGSFEYDQKDIQQIQNILKKVPRRKTKA